MLSFKITVVAVVAVILLLFAFGAYKAEIVIAKRAKEQLESQPVKNTNAGKSSAIKNSKKK